MYFGYLNIIWILCFSLWVELVCLDVSFEIDFGDVSRDVGFFFILGVFDFLLLMVLGSWIFVLLLFDFVVGFWG